MPTRTFLALDLEQDIRRRLLDVQRHLSLPGSAIRWVGDDQLHVTIKFLGDVPDEMLSHVCEIASAVAGEVPAFDFDVKGVVCVPPSGRDIRMIWVGVDDPTGRMSLLYQKLQEGLDGLGLHCEERGFRPHITLGRIKYARNCAAIRAAARAIAGQDFGIQHAGELVAYGSVLTAQGPVYTPLCRAKLG